MIRAVAGHLPGSRAGALLRVVHVDDTGAAHDGRTVSRLSLDDEVRLVLKDVVHRIPRPQTGTPRYGYYIRIRDLQWTG